LLLDLSLIYSEFGIKCNLDARLDPLLEKRNVLQKNFFWKLILSFFLQKSKTKEKVLRLKTQKSFFDLSKIFIFVLQRKEKCNQLIALSANMMKRSQESLI
jgi:hypothetical protein